MAQAAAVFEGRATSMGRASTEDGGAFGGELRYEFEVLRIWKGELGEAVVLHTPSSSAACGRTYAIGEPYIIYASRGQDGELADFLCSRTRRSAGADEDLAVLGPGRSPLAPAGGSSTQGGPDREPPRIEPPPAEEPPATANPRGCAIAPETATAPLVLILAALGRRRRPRR